MSIARSTSVAAAIAGAVVMLGATAASAHDDGPYGHDRGKHRGPPFVPPGHVRVYEEPQPLMIYREPVYYVPPPVYYPRPQPGMSINFNFPLR